MSKKWTKSLSVLLSILLVAIFVSACGGDKKSAEPASGSAAAPSAKASESQKSDAPKTEKTNIKFWVLFDGSDADTMRKIVEDYNGTHPDSQVTLEFQDNAQYYTKLKTAILGGTGPDLAISHIGGNINGMAATGDLIPLDQEASRLGVDIAFDKYSKDPTTAANIGGKQYAVPLDNLVRVLMYNKDVLSKAGLVGQDGKLNFQMSFDGFKQALDKVKASSPGVQPLTVSMKPPQLVLVWLSLYYQLGGTDFLSIEQKKATFDDAKATEALKALHDLYAAYVPAKLTDPAGLDMFKAGKSAFFIDGSWSIGAAAQALGDKFGVTGFPYLFSTPTEVTTSHGFVLPKNADRTDAETKAALEFIKWFGDNNWKWAQAGHVPAYGPALETPEFKALPYHPQFTEPGRNVVALPVIPGTMLHQAPEVKDFVQAAVSGDKTPEEAVALIRKGVDSMLSQLVK
ncbi:extracellular solute-binding protein [Cohnella candidum]|nr:extracellular solute-binding protein [Cohnella candidum]